MNHLLRILLIALAGFVGPARAADPKPAPKGEVIEFGTFELVGPEQKVANARTLDGAERNAPAARLKLVSCTFTVVEPGKEKEKSTPAAKTEEK